MSVKVFVIGGAGFIGERFCTYASSRGVNCAVGDVNTDAAGGSKFVDVTDPATLEDIAGSDVIINLAAEHRDDVKPLEKYMDVNVGGAKNICDAARRNNITSIIFLSSVAVYGEAAPNTDEDGVISYFNEYGRTKYMAEEVFRRWFNEDPDNRTLTIIRPTAVFGEGNRGNIYNLLRQIERRRFVMFGNGRNIKSIAYVENVAAFIFHCLSKRSGLHIFNYVDKPDLDMNQFVSLCREVIHGQKGVGLRLPTSVGLVAGAMCDVVAWLTGRSLAISSIRIRKFLMTTQISAEAAHSEFMAPTSLEAGLMRTMKYEFGLSDLSVDRSKQ